MPKCSTKKAKLAREVGYELEQLEKLSSVASELLVVPDSERKPWHAAAGAKYVADLSAGLENLCRRRCAYLGQPPPEGPNSHAQLLEDFLAAEGLGRVLSDELKLRLRKYLRFRHRFVHGYGFDVSWEIVSEPLGLLADTVAALATVWRTWVATLPDGD